MRPVRAVAPAEFASQTPMYEYKVIEVLRVVDGDTFDLHISMGFGASMKLRFRLANYDAAETYGPKASPEGAIAKATAQEWLDAHPNLKIRTHKGSQKTIGLGDGSFGRWLADIIDIDTGEDLKAYLESQT